MTGRPDVAAGRLRRTAAALAVTIAACSSDDSSSGTTATSDTTAPAVTAPPSTTATASIVERADWGEEFAAAGLVGTFVLREVGTDETLTWNSARADEPRLPASTFKILNSMVILETGTLPDVDTEVPWDGVDREVEVWNRNHDLRSGIEVSAVWMYQAMAREVGEQRMRELVSAAGYGNADIGGGIDLFWLRGDLRISPLEQLNFLESMVEGDLPFRSDVVDQVRDILVRESGADWAWSHKTGTALAAEPVLGWLVGTAENAGRTWVFALNVDLGSVGRLDTQIGPLARQDLARRLLAGEGALPAD